MDLPSSREEAKAGGIRHYFTGVLCPHGHLSKRYTSSGGCFECLKLINGTEVSRAASRKHKKTEKGKLGVLKYEKSEKGQIVRKRIVRSEKVKASRKARYLHRLETEPTYALRAALRNRMNKALKYKLKAGSSVRDLGCSIEDFQIYCEQHPNWNPEWTWSDKGKLFQLDHVKALGLFDLTDRDQFLAAAHYTNQQPLSIEEHAVKSREDTRLIKWFQKASDGGLRVL
jgi:hypothetical protein